MVTPFTARHELDLERVTSLVDELIDSGSDALVIAGTTGESPTLTAEERRLLLVTAVRAARGRVPVIAGTGTNSTATSIELTRQAEDLRVDGVMLVTPYYNRPPQAALKHHFEQVAAATSLPVMLYDVPARTGCRLHAPTVLELAGVKNIVALKDAGGDLNHLSALLGRLPGDFTVYSGDDALTLPALSLGAAGVVSVASHLAGALLRDLIVSFAAGRVAVARALHHRLFPLFTALGVTTNPIPVKAGLALMGRSAGPVRPPLLPATGAESAVVQQALVATGLVAPEL